MKKRRGTIIRQGIAPVQRQNAQNQLIQNIFPLKEIKNGLNFAFLISFTYPKWLNRAKQLLFQVHTRRIYQRQPITEEEKTYCIEGKLYF